MYRQIDQMNRSSDSVRRLSSNNPFRQFAYDPPSHHNGSETSVRSAGSNKAFEDWVEKNKRLLEESDDEIEDLYQSYNDIGPSGLGRTMSSRNYSKSSGASSYAYLSRDSTGREIDDIKTFDRPAFPHSSRSGSDTSVNYTNLRMASNNPFANGLEESETVKRNNPARQRNGGAPPARPPKNGVLPPSYEEAAGTEATRKEYPREKQERNGSSSRHRHSSRPHRSHSESEKHSRSSKSGKGDKERRRRSKKTETVKPKNLDTIDKLDVTAFFGSGFHHDGPFDACTPHRNKNVKAAPVMAFPADGPNNSIKGAVGSRKDEQMDLAFGYDTVDQRIYSDKRTQSNDAVPVIKTNRVSNDIGTSLHTPKQNPSVINFDANLNAEPIHGNVTAGLGSSTFIDGAPAPKHADEFLAPNNLGRKKSLVQRLKKTSSENNSRRNSNDEFLDAREFSSSEDNDLKSSGNSLLRRVKSLKVGGRRK